MAQIKTFDNAEDIAFSRYAIALEKIAGAIFKDEVKFEEATFIGRVRAFYPINLEDQETFQTRLQKLDRKAIEDIDFRYIATDMQDLEKALKQGSYKVTDLFKKFARTNQRYPIVLLGNCLYCEN